MNPAKQNRRALRQEAMTDAFRRARAAGNMLPASKLKAGLRTQVDRACKTAKAEGKAI